MYSILGCPDGQHLAAESACRTGSPGITLHLQENRSSLSAEARTTFTVLIGLFMAMAILPAIKGEMLVPIYALVTMALLVVCLEWHQRTQPSAELLTIETERLMWRSNRHGACQLPTRSTRLVEDDSLPASLRLYLVTHWQRIEIGRCLSHDERRLIAPLIVRHLREVGA